MQDINQLPLKQWAEQLSQAREAAGLDFASLAQALRLSNAQLRGLETGALSAFHGPGYYLRAVEKYANHLHITLDPPVTDLSLTDSQIALNRVKTQPSAAKLAKREALTFGAAAMPRTNHPTRLGVWLVGLLLVLVGAGTWLAIGEGWPGNEHQETLVVTQTTGATGVTKATVAAPDSPNAELSSSAQSNLVTNDAATAADILANNAASDTSVGTENVIGESRATTASATSASEPLANQPELTTTIASGLTVAPEPSPAPSPAQTQNPVEPEVTATPDVFEATFNADCWVEVRFTNGNVEQRIYQPGQVLSVDIEQVNRLTFGNAQAVSAVWAGKPLDINAFTRARNNVARISAPDLQSARPSN